MNFELQYLAALDALIVVLGGVVPVAASRNFQVAHLLRLVAVVNATGGVLPSPSMNYHAAVLAHWRAAIVARGGVVPTVFSNFSQAVLLHVQAFQTTRGLSVALSGLNFEQDILALVSAVLTGLNFSALTALPAGRQSAVTTAANAAAATLGVTAQSIVDAIGAGRGVASMLPSDGCLLASSGGALTVQGDPVGAIRSWTGVELATQSNASLRAISAAAGLSADGTKSMNVINLSAQTEGESIAVVDFATTTNTSALWHIGTQAAINSAWSFIVSTVSANFDDYGTTVRSTYNWSPNSEAASLLIYGARASGTSQVLSVNATDRSSTSGKVIGFLSTPTLLSNGASAFMNGLLMAVTFNGALYTTAQRNAVREFCRNYYGVTY